MTTLLPCLSMPSRCCAVMSAAAEVAATRDAYRWLGQMHWAGGIFGWLDFRCEQIADDRRAALAAVLKFLAQAIIGGEPGVCLVHVFDSRPCCENRRHDGIVQGTHDVMDFLGSDRFSHGRSSMQWVPGQSGETQSILKK